MRVQTFVTEEKGVGLKGWLSGPRRRTPADQPDLEKPVPLDKHRIAVLPMTNISPDPKDAYFADGMTEEMITVLSQVQGLRVIARTSVNRYSKREKSVAQIATELQVGSVMEGSVRMAGERIRVGIFKESTYSHVIRWTMTAKGLGAKAFLGSHSQAVQTLAPQDQESRSRSTLSERER